MSKKVFYKSRYGGIIESMADNTIWENDPDYVRIPEKEAKQKRKDRAIEQLSEMLKVGDTIYTLCESRSNIGTGKYRLFIAYDNRIVNITHYVKDILDYRMKNGSIVENFCGSDASFMLVYELASVLYKDGFSCIGKDCGSDDHANGDRNYAPHLHSNGGYALRYTWL